jgi:hypothetical protein
MLSKGAGWAFTAHVMQLFVEVMTAPNSAAYQHLELLLVGFN